MAEWRAIAEFPSYEISSNGNVRRISDSRMMSPKPDGSGYVRVTFSTPGRKSYRYIHRLLAITFHGEPNGLIARHINGDRLDNRAENIRYGTHRDNRMDAVKHGTARNGGPRFDADGRACLREAALRLDTASLAKTFGITPTYARHVRAKVRMLAA